MNNNEIRRNQQGQPVVTLNETTDVKCDKCQGTVFTDGMLLRRASTLVTGQPHDSYIPIPVFVCSSCGNVNDEFIPPALKSSLVTK